jgi:hypothetical protein
MIASAAWLGCSSSESQPASGGAASPTPSGAGASGAGAAGAAQPAAGAGTGTGAVAGMSASGGDTGGSSGAAAGGAAAGGAPASGGSAGNTSAGASLGGGGSGASAGAGAGGGAAGAPPANCNLSNPVSFQKDIQGFLAKSCGKTVDGGCHVTDSSKTSLGYDHAYDWITAFAHPGSCGKTAPYAKRFEVVLALLAGPKPASCPNARQMPPPGSTAAPLTACQVAALQAWLAEPLVSQMHVPENDDTKALYPAGPYLMPPFN